jgi:hypothetical protein
VYIERLVIAVVLLLLLALAPAMAQIVVYTGQTTPLEVVQNGTDTYTWELFNDPLVNFATASGVTGTAPYAEFVGGSAGAAVQVLWKQPGIYFYRVNAVDPAGCSRNLKVGLIEVKIAAKAVIIAPTLAVCEGEAVSLEITLTGTAPWNFTYTGTDVNGLITTSTVNNVTNSPYTLIIDPGPTKTSDYTVTSISDSNATNTDPSNTVTQIVNPLPAPSKIYHR